MTLTLTIVRHGDTFVPGLPPRRIGRRTDLPLVANGIAQADALGALFAAAGTNFDRVLAAPLRRTFQTADRIRAHLARPAPITPCSWLREIDHGPDEDRPESDVVARIGAAALHDWNESLIAPPGWIVDAAERIAGWRAVLATDAGSVLLVTSNGAARYVFAADPALAAHAAALPSTRLRTGAYGRIFSDHGQCRIDAWDVRPGVDQQSP